MQYMITEGTKEWVDAGYVINTDPDALVEEIIAGIEAKRKALDI
jgi:carbon-monoxide dehydrogenase catalytic subunit